MSPDTSAELKVINADATDEEIAAITAVIVAMGSAGAPAGRKPRATWSSYARRTRPALRPGPGSWRASGLPR